MQTIGYDKYDERRHLFTSLDDRDSRANLFTKALELCPQRKLDECSLLNDIARAKNYENTYKQGMNDNDIHWQFVDFIVKSALYHRNIDESTTSGTRLADINKVLDIQLPLITGEDSTGNYNGLNLIASNRADNFHGQTFLSAVISSRGSRYPPLGTDTFAYPNFGTMFVWSDLKFSDSARLDLTTYLNPQNIAKSNGGVSHLNCLISVLAARWTFFDNEINLNNLANVTMKNLEQKVDQLYNAVLNSNFYYIDPTTGRFDKPKGKDLIKIVIGDHRSGLVKQIISSYGIVTKNNPIGSGELQDGMPTPAEYESTEFHDQNKGTLKNIRSAPYSLIGVINKLNATLSNTVSNLEVQIADVIKTELYKMIDVGAKTTILALLKEINIQAPQYSNLLVRDYVTAVNNMANGIAMPTNIYNSIGGMITNHIPNVLKKEVFGMGDQLGDITKPLSNTLIVSIKNEIKKIVSNMFMPQHTTLQSSASKDLFDNAISKWDNMTDSARNFYLRYLMVMEKQQNGWTPVPESQYGNINVNNLTNYRFNLKKTDDLSITQFEHDLPDFPTNNLANLHYTDANNNKTIVSVNRWNTNNKEFFRKLYNCVYNNKIMIHSGVTFNLVKDYNIAKNVLSTPNGIFGLNIDDLVKNRLLRISSAKINISNSELDNLTSNDFTDLINNNIWHKENNSFVKKINGQTIKYGINDPATQQLLQASHNCYSSLYAGTEEQCHKFMFDCLLNDDNDSLMVCIDRFKVSNFNEVAKKEINNIHPTVALRILQKMGFRTKSSYDNVFGAEIKKVENVNHWYNSVIVKRYGEVDARKLVATNSRLLAYLDLLVQFVNSNPGILNNNIQGNTEEKLGITKPTEFVQALGIKPRIEPPLKSLGNYEFQRLSHKLMNNSSLQVANLPFMSNQMSGKWSTPFGMSLTPNVSQYVQVGGGSGSASWLVDTIYDSPNKITGSELMRQIFNILLNDLSNRNKTLNPANKKAIMDAIEAMKISETLILKNLLYIEEYNKLIDAFQGNKNSEILTTDGIREFVDLYKKSQKGYQSQEQTMLKLLNDVQKLIGDDDQYNPIKL